MAKMMTNEVKTGLLVVICLTILIVFTVSVGKISMFGKQYRIQVLFNWVAGLENDAPVRLSGVNAGKVEDVKLIYRGDETKVLLTLVLDSDAKVREDSKAHVTTLGLMGEKYVELTAGSSGKPFLKPGKTIEGEDPLQMEELVKIGKQIAAEVEATLGDIRKLTNHIDELVVDNREDIDETIGNLNRTTKNLEEFSYDLKNNPWKLFVKETKKTSSKGNIRSR